MTGHFTRRVITAIFAQSRYAGDAEREDLFRDRWRHVTLQLDEFAVGVVLETRLQPGTIDIEGLGELLPLAARLELIAWIGPDGFDRRTDRERLAVAVGDHAAKRGHAHHAEKPRIALPLQKLLVQELQIDRAPHEAAHRLGHDGEQRDTPAAVCLRLVGYSHGFNTTIALCSGITKPNNTLATSSMRPCVAQVLCFNCSWSHSISMSSRAGGGPGGAAGGGRGGCFAYTAPSAEMITSKVSTRSARGWR